MTGGTTFRQAYHGHPLAGRQNYILTHDDTPIPGAVVVHDLEQLLDDFKNKDLWIAGGARVFQEVIDLGAADELYLTHIEADCGCDQFFPEYRQDFKRIRQSESREQNGFRFTYAVYATSGRP